MKTKLLLLLSLSVILGACGTEDAALSQSPVWGIDFSSENTAGFAMGTVDKFSGESKTTYVIKAANLRSAGDDVYTLRYTFESGDNMVLTLAKRTIDANFPYPGKDGENQLISVSFNDALLDLSAESKISIQPRSEENKLATITKLQTVGTGLFDGVIGRVPLLK